MKKERTFPAEPIFFEIYREYLSAGLASVSKKYGLVREDMKFILNNVEEKICNIQGILGDLEKTASQCGFSKKIIEDILIKGKKFISSSKGEAYEFMLKKEKF